MRFHLLTLTLAAGLLAGCAVEQENGGVLPLDRRLPLSAQTMAALGGPEVAHIFLGAETDGLAVERMRLNGDRRYGPAWVTFPERRARPVVDDALNEGLCSVRLRRLVMADDGRGVRDIKRVRGRIVLGGVRIVPRTDPAFGPRLAASRAACADWSRTHPEAWFVQEDLVTELVPVAQGLADLPAAIAAGRIDCAETCTPLGALVASGELTGASGCNPEPEDGGNALCVVALFDTEGGGYAWDEVRMTGPTPAAGEPFRPTRARVDSQFLIVN